MITGYVEFNYSRIVKASGAIAIFCIMYFFVPTIYDKAGNTATAKLSLFAVISNSIGVQKIDVDFDKNASDKITNMAAKLLSKYLGSKINPSDFTCFRNSDGRKCTHETCREIDAHGIIMVSNSVATNFVDKRQEYLHYKPIVDSLSLQ